MFQSMRYIYEVYKEMSFSKAAKNLYISQPSLSAAVKKEEDKIGFPIFDRSRNPIQLTELGREYIRSAEIIMDVENGFQNYVCDLADMKSGSFTIGGTNFFISYVLPPLLSRFSEMYPKIRVELIEGATADLVDKLAEGRIELLLDYSMQNTGNFSRKILQEEHLLMAVPANYACNAEAKKYSLTAADIKTGIHLSTRIAPVPLKYFKEAPFLLLREGNSTRECAMKIFRNSQFEPDVRLELEQQITAYNLSCHGMGISFIGDSLIQNVPQDDNLLFYKLRGQDAVREINLYYKKNRYISRAVMAFLNMADTLLL